MFRVCIVAMVLLVCAHAHAQQVPANAGDSGMHVLSNKLLLHDSIAVAMQSANRGLARIKATYDSINLSVNNTALRITRKIDSLARLNVVAPGLAKHLDSINQWKTEKIAELQRRTTAIESKVDAIEKKFGEGPGSLLIPDELKALDTEFKELRGHLNTGANAQNVLPNELMTMPPNSMAVAELPDLSKHTEGISVGDASKLELDPAALTNRLTDMKDEAGANLEQAIGLADVKKEIGKADALENMGDGLNEEALKSKIKEEVEREAVNHFAGQEKQLEQAMEKLGKLKLKYESVGSIADLPKRRPNPMKGKSFPERSVIGINIQFQRKDAWMLDFNPYAGYRIDRRFTTGIGWNQRVAFDWDQRAFQQSLVVFGPRAYMQVAIKKGFSARLEGEYMNTVLPPPFGTGRIDEKNRAWVFTPMAGIVKEYRFIKRVNGTMAVMYKFYDPHHRSPYNSPLNVRMGFEIAAKRTRATQTGN